MSQIRIDISNDLLVSRLGNGIRLIQPDNFGNEQNRLCSVLKLLKSPFHVYFMNTDSIALKINEACAETCGFLSENDAIGKTPFDVAIKENASLAVNTDKAVIATHKTKIIEQDMLRHDGLSYPCLVIKTPFYNNKNKIIGVFGCSIVLGRYPLAESLSQIAKLGLLNTSSSNILTGSEINNIYLSKRALLNKSL